MRLRTVHANAIVFAFGVAVLGLTACVQNGGRTTAIPAQTPYAYGLFYMDEGRSAKLAYGAANSDDVSLMMQCVKGSHMVDVSDVARDGSGATLTLISGKRSESLRTAPSRGDGETLLIARTSTDAPPLVAFRQSGRIDVAYPGAKYVIVAGPSERIGVERFFAACNQSTVAAIQPR
jgi:hypothetical protein